MYWVGQKVCSGFFCKIKDRVFTFSNNFIDLDILSMSAVSHVSQLMSQFDRYQLELVYLTVEHHLARNLQHRTSQTTFNTFNQSQHFLHTLDKSFFSHFYLSYNNKA